MKNIPLPPQRTSLSEYNMSEIALKEKVEDLRRFATVVSDSNDAIILHDFDGKILAWNSGAKETYGYTEAEALSMNVRDIVAEADREAALTLIEKIKHGEIVKSFELRRVAKDGRILDVWLTTTLLTDKNGEPVAIATTERDITERNQAEIALKKQVEDLRRFATVVSDSNDAIILHDFDGKILAWNSGAKETYGYTEAEALSMNVRDIVAEADRDAALTLIEKIKHGKFVKAFELRRIAKDGRLLDVWLTITLLTDKNGEPVAIATTERDITERNKVEIALKEKLEDLRRFATVVSDSNDAIILHDFDGKILAWNSGAKETYGYTEVEALGMNVRDIVAEADREAALTLIEKIMQGEVVKSFELRRIAKDGRILDVWLTTTLLTDKNAEPVAIATTERDITERNQAEIALKKQVEDLRRFATVVSDSNDAIILHDFDGKILAWNSGAKETYGYTEAEALSMNVRDIVAEADRDAALTLIQKIKHGEIVKSFELRRVAKDGRILDVWLTITLLTDKKGKPVAIATTERDITERNKVEIALKEQVEDLRRFATVVSDSNDAIILHDFDGKILAWNSGAKETYGYTEAEALGMNVRDIVAEADRDAALTLIQKIKHGNIVKSFELRRVAKDGRILDVWLTTTLLTDKNGQPVAIATTERDITERNKAEIALKEKLEVQRRFATVVSDSNDAIILHDFDGKILAWNSGAKETYGYTETEALGMNLRDIVAEADREEALTLIEKIKQGEIVKSFELRRVAKDGRILDVWLTTTLLTDKNGEPVAIATTERDITERNQATEIALYQANFDPLTELPNRRLFHDRLQQGIKKAKRDGKKLALMFLDLDLFKDINDTLGHAMGDVLLQEVANRLTQNIRESDTVARMGGDEFTIIIGELTDIVSVERVAQSILQGMVEPFKLGNELGYISASIGITIYPDDATEGEELLIKSDQAMYAAKRQGRNRICYFTASMQEIAQARMELTHALRGALAGNQFWVAYQPIVELATGAIHKAEALLRWQHPERGLISPAEFIPLAEETGLINSIGDWVFRQAAHQTQIWRADFHPNFQISVNKSPVQFRVVPNLQATWFEQLQELGLDGQSIVVEITEGLLMDANNNITDQLLAFHDAGIQVSLDDFGTGYSSLSYLKRFDIDYLKIDQSFVRNLTPDSDDMALCSAIIVMAHALRIQVIAEGVETAEQRDLLTAAGCDYGQGYLWSKPVRPDELERLLTKP